MDLQDAGAGPGPGARSHLLTAESSSGPRLRGGEARRGKHQTETAAGALVYHSYIYLSSKPQEDSPKVRLGVRCRQGSLLSGSLQASDVPSGQNPTGLGKPTPGRQGQLGHAQGSMGTSSFMETDQIQTQVMKGDED